MAENSYHIVYQDENTLPQPLSRHMEYTQADSTSYSKIMHILSQREYSDIFIVLEDENDAKYTLNNIRMLDERVRIVLANIWGGSETIVSDENTHMINTKNLAAAHLFDELPNVPVIAQNVGLARGEIMEVLVPFGSTYAFRHVGSILQRKWKIAAIYRDEKQLIPTNATMIRPNDTLLIIGKPMVLDGIYKTINKNVGLFPEPYGKNLYLLLDFRFNSAEEIPLYIQQSKYLLEQLENRQLFVRIIHVNNFKLLEHLRMELKDVAEVVMVDFGSEKNISNVIESDIQKNDIGLVLSSIDTFHKNSLNQRLFALHKMVYLFGDKLLYNIKEAIVLLEESQSMESISSSAFDVAQTLGLKLTLADYNPEGDFEKNKMIVEHYDTLTQIFDIDINIEKKVANPIREIAKKDELLQIVPFEESFNTYTLLNLISSKLKDFILTSKRHPKLLVPYN